MHIRLHTHTHTQREQSLSTCLICSNVSSAEIEGSHSAAGLVKSVPSCSSSCLITAMTLMVWCTSRFTTSTAHHHTSELPDWLHRDGGQYSLHTAQSEPNFVTVRDQAGLVLYQMHQVPSLIISFLRDLPFWKACFSSPSHHTSEHSPLTVCCRHT